MRLLRTPAAQGTALALLAGVALGAQVPRDRPVPTAAATGTAVISGRMTVTTPNGIAPVRRARITLESDTLRQPLTTDTDTEGRYRFSALPAGSVRVRGDKAGFVPKVADPRRAFEPPPAMDLKPGQALSIDLPMQPGAALEGRILKENGDPAGNIIVSAVRMAYDVNGRKPTSVQQVKTDDLGRFRVHTLPPGDYQIDAAPDPLDANRQIQTPGQRPPTPSRTYYPGTLRFEEARVVSVTVGQTAGSLDFTIANLPMALLRGKVTSADGAPANGAAVRLQRVGGPVGEVRGASSIQSNDFSYPSVPAGDFWMMAVARPAPSADPEFGLMRLSMDGRDIANLTVATAKQPPLSGRVEGVAIPSGLKVVAYETAFEWPALNGEPPQADRWTAPVSPDGAFSFKALPGPRLLRVTGQPPGVTIKQILFGDADVTDTSFEVKAGDSVPPIRVVLTSETATLSGVVKDASGQPAAAARVVMFSDDERLWGLRSRAILATESRGDGTYEIRGVLPGKYRIVAMGFLESLAWTDASVLHQLATAAEAVTVAAGNVTRALVVKR